MEEDLVEIFYDELIRETDKATLFRIDDEEVWVPKSIMPDIDKAEGVFRVYEWFAFEKELI